MKLPTIFKKKTACSKEQESKKLPEEEIKFNEEEFMRVVKSAILSEYPDIKELKLVGSFECTFFKSYTLDISWKDGVHERFIKNIVDIIKENYPVGKMYFGYLYPYVNLRRKYDDETILDAARKYADCISKDLPINMHNIHCFKLGDTSLYELATGELGLMDKI